MAYAASDWNSERHHSIPQSQRAPVFIVEDDRATRESMKALLELEGYRVVTAFDGADGLRKLREGLHPCLILLDLMMPRVNGFEFRQQQVTDPGLANIPVVVYSGAYTQRPSAALLKGAAYFQKPVSFEALLEIVEKHCRGKTGGSPQRR